MKLKKVISTLLIALVISAISINIFTVPTYAVKKAENAVSDKAENTEKKKSSKSENKTTNTTS